VLKPSLKLMQAQHAIKNRVKPLLFRGGVQPRRIRFGLAAGALMRLDRQNDLQREFGLYEVEAKRFYRRSIERDGIVYDVGAFDGHSALVFAKLAAAGHVFSFEPDPAARDRMAANLALNPELAERVTILPLFVGNGTIVDGVRSVRIDKLIEDGTLPPPTFVKIDVDGPEVQVLEGMRETIARARCAFFVEVHSAQLEQTCTEALRAAGYTVRLVRNAWWRLLYPELRPLELNRWLYAQVESGYVHGRPRANQISGDPRHS
jgi:hypothetical protein